ncbi:TPA: hypothetical protein R0C45_002630 [Kluyvera ascorbata F0526]|nr:hypothetical protein [Kluyvera ascorbata F0526]
MYINILVLVVLMKCFNEVNNMGFVNEFITDEKEIQKFDLDNVYNACDLGPGNRKWPEARLDGSARPCLTIDRERNIWLMYVGGIDSYENSRSGYPEPTGVRVFVLHYQGKNYEFKLKKSQDSSPNIHNLPFVIIWQLSSISPEINNEKEYIEIISSLKNALTIFGVRGARILVPDTIVRFEF